MRLSDGAPAAVARRTTIPENRISYQMYKNYLRNCLQSTRRGNPRVPRPATERSHTRGSAFRHRFVRLHALEPRLLCLASTSSTLAMCWSYGK